MLCGQVALIILSALMMISSLELSPNPLTEAGVGETATLTCNVTGHESGLFYWYKMSCGYMIQTVALGFFDSVNLEAQFKILRFEIKKVGNVYSLIIRNIQKEDEATYFCQAGAAYRMVFVNGTNLAVNQYDVETSRKTLFGNTTTVETNWGPTVIGLGVLCVLCMIVIAILVFFRD